MPPLGRWAFPAIKKMEPQNTQNTQNESVAWIAPRTMQFDAASEAANVLSKALSLTA